MFLEIHATKYSFDNHYIEYQIKLFRNEIFRQDNLQRPHAAASEDMLLLWNKPASVPLHNESWTTRANHVWRYGIEKRVALLAHCGIRRSPVDYVTPGQ